MSLALSLQCCWRRLGLLLWQKSVRPAIRPGSALLLQRIVIIVAYLAVLQLCRAARAPLASTIGLRGPSAALQHDRATVNSRGVHGWANGSAASAAHAASSNWATTTIINHDPQRTAAVTRHGRRPSRIGSIRRARSRQGTG